MRCWFRLVILMWWLIRLDGNGCCCNVWLRFIFKWVCKLILNVVGRCWIVLLLFLIVSWLNWRILCWFWKLRVFILSWKFYGLFIRMCCWVVCCYWRMVVRYWLFLKKFWWWFSRVLCCWKSDLVWLLVVWLIFLVVSVCCCNVWLSFIRLVFGVLLMSGV